MTGEPSPLVVASVPVPPPITGQATAAQILVDELIAQGIDHIVLDTNSPIDGTGLSTRVGIVARTLRHAARVLRTRAADGAHIVAYVHLGQGRSSMMRDLVLLLAIRARGWRRVGHVHGGGWRTGFDSLPTPLRRVYRRAIADLDSVIVLTPSLRSMFAGIVDDERITVVGNTVAAEVEAAATDHPARWSVDPVVLFLGNLMPEKGYDTLLEAAAIVERRGHGPRFELAGDASDLDIDRWPATARSVGEVQGTAKTDLLASSQLLALPTRYWVEGEPISIIEAFHFGLPVVACARGGVADLVGADQGELVPERDPEALLAAIERQLEPDRWHQVSATNRAAAASRHGLNRHLDQLFAAIGLPDRRAEAD